MTPAAGDVADARIHEESEAEKLLASMEKQDPTSDEFAASFGRLKQAVLQHAEHEEAEVFPLIRQNEPEDARVSMGQRFEKAKRAAPTHPHPHAPDTPPGNLVMGPVAAMVDRMRDAMRKSDEERG